MKKTLIALALTAGATFGAFAQDIVDVAAKAGNFNTLVAAVKAADLVDTLKGPGPFTVFAPTDAAFAKIPKAKLDALLAEYAALGLPAKGIPRLHPGVQRIAADLRMFALVDPDGSLIRCIGP